jgi:hypothetical protein
VYLRAFASHRAGERQHGLWGALAVAMAFGAVVRVAFRRMTGPR